jgi:hypothetical protein
MEHFTNTINFIFVLHWRSHQHFVSFPTSTKYWTEDVNFDFVVHWVFIPCTTRPTDMCIWSILICTTAVNTHSVVCFPLSPILKHTAYQIKVVHRNEDIRERRNGKHINTTGKVCELILLITYSLFLLLFLCLCCLFCFFSGPAHILCLNAASGWNKERCIPKI